MSEERLQLPSTDKVLEKIRAYLDGGLSLQDFDDWCDDPTAARLYDEDASEAARRMLNDLSLMFCEMTCSGCYRTEAMFRQDCKSILAGQPPLAFWIDPEQHIVPAERFHDYAEWPSVKRRRRLDRLKQWKNRLLGS